MHLFFNNLSIIFFGFYTEHLLGVFKYTILYISSGFFSLLLSSVVDSTNLSVGASGSIMGISAYFLLFYILNYRDLSDINKKYFYYFLAITIMNLFQTTTNKGDKIDISSHIGGFVSGVLISLLLVDLSQIKYEDQIIMIKKLKIISTVILILILAVLSILLMYINNIDPNLKYNC
jgi:membrane associated rhomboid family serine protease